MLLECIEGNTRYLLFTKRANLYVQIDSRLKDVQTLNIEEITSLLLNKNWVEL